MWSSPAAADLEHRALDHALAEVEFLAEKRNFAAAAQRFAGFRDAFERHLQEEETVIFPELEQRATERSPGLPVLRAQHRRLEALLGRVGSALSRADYASFCAGLAELEPMLKEHQATEERLLGVPAGLGSAAG